MLRSKSLRFSRILLKSNKKKKYHKNPYSRTIILEVCGSDLPLGFSLISFDLFFALFIGSIRPRLFLGTCYKTKEKFTGSNLLILYIFWLDNTFFVHAYWYDRKFVI